MSETTIHYIVNAAVYACMGLGFFILTNHAVKWYYRQMLKKILEIVVSENSPIYTLVKENIHTVHGINLQVDVIMKDIEGFRSDCQNGYEDFMEQFASLEEKIVMVHQDILYLDQDFDDVEERIVRLEYRPTKPEPTTIEAQALPPRMERSMRRMRELRRRQR